MDENELKTGDVTEQEVESGQDIELENTDSNVDAIDRTNMAEFTDSEQESDKKMRSADDAKFARMRRENERKKQKQQADYDKGMLDAVDGVNPFTGEKIIDDEDLNEYKIMREIAKNGGDPLADYRKFVKDRSRKLSQETKQKLEQQRRYEDDVSAFQSKYPEKLKELTKDERFAIFAKGKVGKMPLVDIYEDYVKFTDFVSKDATAQAEKMYSNAMSSTGSLSAGESATSKSYLDMSDAEFEKVYQKALNGGLSKK